MLQWSVGDFTGPATFHSVSCLALLPPCLTYLFLGHLRGLSYGAGHVCSWGWRPRNANPPPQLRKVPCLPVQNENNKEPSVAAASGVQCTHQNMSKSHFLLPSIHAWLLSSPVLSLYDPLFNLWETCTNATWKMYEGFNIPAFLDHDFRRSKERRAWERVKSGLYRNKMIPVRI